MPFESSHPHYGQSHSNQNVIIQATDHPIYSRTHRNLCRPHLCRRVPLIRSLRCPRHQRHHELSRDRMPYGSQEGREGILASIVVVGPDQKAGLKRIRRSALR